MQLRISRNINHDKEDRNLLYWRHFAVCLNPYYISHFKLTSLQFAPTLMQDINRIMLTYSFYSIQHSLPPPNNSLLEPPLKRCFIYNILIFSLQSTTTSAHKVESRTISYNLSVFGEKTKFIFSKN